MRSSTVVTGLMLSMLMLSAASAGMLYGVTDNERTLNWIDPDSLVGGTIGPLGVATGSYGDLAYDEASGTMWWAAGRGNNNLYTINLTTGAATLVGSHGIDDLFTLGYDGHKLYGQSFASQVYSIDKTTGAATLIGTNAVYYPGGYDWNPNVGQMVLLDAGPGDIYSVNLTDGSVSLLADAPLTSDNDIAYDIDRNVYWATDYYGYLYHYDTLWNRTTPLAGLSVMAALEYVPDVTVVPLPPALVLAIAGLLSSLVGLQRKHVG